MHSAIDKMVILLDGDTITACYNCSVVTELYIVYSSCWHQHHSSDTCEINCEYVYIINCGFGWCRVEMTMTISAPSQLSSISDTSEHHCVSRTHTVCWWYMYQVSCQNTIAYLYVFMHAYVRSNFGYLWRRYDKSVILKRLSRMKVGLKREKAL